MSDSNPKNDSNVDSSVDHRRSFLKLAGFGMFAACSRGLEYKAIPLLNPVEERIPGVASWYSSLCAGCSAGCGVLARSRDGSPVKLEGNPEHPVSKGGLCAVGQASVLSLYDSYRLKHPLAMREKTGWKQVDDAVRAQLARAGDGAVRFLTGTTNSPTALAAIERFGRQFRDFRHIQYDALSASAMLDVHEKMFARRGLPRMRFDRAEVIVGFDADFLGTWISPMEFTRDYRRGRNPDEGAEYLHVQFEARMSLTGSNADRRYARSPAEIAQAISQLAVALCRLRGVEPPFAAEPAPEIEALAESLHRAPRGKTLVVCGVDDHVLQSLVASINDQLGNYGSTLDTTRLSRQKLGSTADLDSLRTELAAGKVRVLLVGGCNPAYDLPGGINTDKVDAIISFAEREDETAAQAHFVCPDHHALESWGDAEAVEGIVTVCQPTAPPLGETRAMIESLARWSGDERGAHALMRETWKESLFPVSPLRREQLRAPQPPAGEAGQLALVLYPTVGMLDGRHAHNPWLHELPDPVTKVVWDNYASLSAATAARLEFEQGDLVELMTEGGGVTLPVHIQHGQHDDVVAVALGYGRKGTDRFAHVGPQWLEGEPTVEEGALVGANAAPLLGTPFVSVKKAKGRRDLACTQTYESMIVPEHLGGTERPVARQTTLKEHREHDPEDEMGHGGGHHPTGELWPEDHKFKGHHWGMAVDLSACTGCSACVIGCQSENNVPVVGRDEVIRFREMHWMRIDRYYGGEGDDTTVAHQPMMCQHCDNAPCETVCPVLATVQSSEGLNQQVYNRCVGTRYCANNCPYKVRRFNWFDYPHNDKLANNSLNPDVVVRMRGIMEKCSFCIQRISGAKADARNEGRELRDGEIQPACMQSCPADAIIFGDLNDPDSAVSKARRDRRHYRVLEDVNTKPGVGYLSLVRNRDV
ncbi:MAG: 4Fe-4S dicluster domain-containing protein [Planctomycetota bacterium]|jgi:molybdopterin-containing oxidoreductase family iron-sulfur binding subunit